MQKGEIWLINLDPTIGAEIQKTRPAIIVNEDAIGVLPLRVIVPITEWKDRYAVAPWMIRISPTPENSLTKLSSADAFQIRSVSTARFVEYIGQVSPATLAEVLGGIKTVIGV
ncbi:MAG: type II toxin-antitoxin system PemK/MazF family toxin [Anaerolineae bacterium]|jgi:mRNA interferase MazF|nr:type II toxin-antitoxin system PemK/MazF family toxin [Anaerolineae bacterium]